MSKKLENNGLWESSRMMLPEHKEALLAHRNPSTHPTTQRSQLPTEEELNLIRHVVLLPIMLTIVESNGRSIETLSSPLKKLYIKATQVLLQHIHTDLVHIKKTLRERNIKVFEDERIDGSLRYRFVCRGYEDHFVMIRDVVRAELSVKITHYISLIFQEQAAASH
jgi:hypothetical protein